MRGTLVQIEAWNRRTQQRETVRVGSALNSTTLGAGGFAWEPALRRAPRLMMQLLDDDMTGELQTGQGELAIKATALRLVSDHRDLEWIGSPITILSGTGQNLARYRTEFVGRITGGVTNTDTGIAPLSFEVDRSLIDVPLLSYAYTGGGGLEGDPEIRGNNLPSGCGAPINVPPILINAVHLVYQVDGYGNTVSIAAVYENLASFGPSAGDYPTYDALVAADITEGTWATCIAQGLFRLGAPPVGTITCDPVFGSARPGSMMLRWLRVHAAVPEAKIRVSDFDALTAAVQAAVGAPPAVSFWTADGASVLDLMQRMCASCNAVPLIMLDGTIGVSRAIGGGTELTLQRKGGTPPTTAWQSQDPPVPWWRLRMSSARAVYVNSPAEISYEDEIRPMGNYTAGETYRQGMVVRWSDGARYLYINAEPAKDIAPPMATHWAVYEDAPDAFSIKYPGGATLAEKEPAEGGATRGAVIGENLWLPDVEQPVERDKIITEEGTSKDTNNVAGVPAPTVVAQIAAAQASIADLFANFGTTVAAGASAALALAAADASDQHRANSLAASVISEQARDAASGFAGVADAHRIAAQQARSDSEAFRNQAVVARDGAEEAYAGAATQSGLAATARSQAEGFATSSAGSAGVATAQADLAGQRATAANTSRIDAQTAQSASEVARNESVQARNDSAGFATTAQANMTLTSQIRNQAAVTVSQSFPENMDRGEDFFVYGVNVPKDVQPGLPSWITFDNTADGRVMVIPTNAESYYHISTRSASPATPGRRYRFEAEARFISGAGATAFVITPYGLSADYGTIFYSGYAEDLIASSRASLPATWTAIFCEFTVSANPVCPLIRPNIYFQTNTTNPLVVHVRRFSVRDVTSERSAAGSATAAQGFATNASASDVSAASQATLSAQYRDQALSHRNDANNSRIDAQAAATASSDSAAAASASAATATSQQQLTASFYVDTARINRNDVFQYGTVAWNWSYEGNRPASQRWIADTNHGGRSALRQIVPNRADNLYADYTIPVRRAPDAYYEVNTSVWTGQAPSGSPGNLVYFGYQCIGADGNPVGTNAGHVYWYSGTRPVGEGWFDHKGILWSMEYFHAGTVAIRPLVLYNYNSATLVVGAVGQIRVTDVSERQAAATQAGIATNQAVIATAQAAAAQTSQELAARLSSPMSNLGSTFSRWTNAAALPNDWADWINGTLNMTRVSGKVGRYAMRVGVPANTPQQGVFTNQNLDAGLVGLTNRGDWVIEAEIEIEGGPSTGAGVLLVYRNSVGNVLEEAMINFAADPSNVSPAQPTGGNVVLGKRYRFTKFVRFTTPPPSPGALFWLYAMSNYPSFGNAAKTIIWHSCGIRPATEAESKAQKVDTLEASVNVQAGVIAGLAARTAAYWGVEAVAGGRAQVRLYADGYGGAVDIVADVIRMGSGSSPALRIVANRPFFSGDVEIGGSVRVGNYRIPLALQTFPLSLADGEVASFGLDIGTYDLQFSTENLSPRASGQAYDIKALSKTGTGFTMSAKKTTPGTPSTVVNNQVSYGGSGPQAQVQKSSAQDSTTGYYTFNYALSYSFAPNPPGQPPAVDDFRETSGVVTFYVNRGSGWVSIGSEYYSFSGSPGDGGTAVMSYQGYFADPIGQHGAAEFGLSVTPYDSGLNAQSSLSYVANVTYQIPGSTGGSATASPNGEKVIVTVIPRNVAF